MNDHEQPGSLIGTVIASLVDRVTRLEAKGEVSKSGIRQEMVRLYLNVTPSISEISRRTGYGTKTVLSHLRKAGVIHPADKKETT